MFAEYDGNKLGIYSRPNSTESTVFDELIYTNDFREACSWVIDLAAEIYFIIKDSLPAYRSTNSSKPIILISTYINPHRNSGDPSRNGRERLRYHAAVTARYLDGHVPTEDGGRMILIFNALLNVIRSFFDRPALRHAEDRFSAYVQIWNRMGRQILPPERFAAILQTACEALINALEELADALHVWETEKWQDELELEFRSADSEVLNRGNANFRMQILADAIAEQRKLDDLKRSSEKSLHIVNRVAKKLKVRNTQFGIKAQDEAYSVWNEYRYSSELIQKCNGRKPSKSDVFSYASHRLCRIGIMTADDFKKALEAKRARLNRSKHR